MTGVGLDLFLAIRTVKTNLFCSRGPRYSELNRPQLPHFQTSLSSQTFVDPLEVINSLEWFRALADFLFDLLSDPP